MEGRPTQEQILSQWSLQAIHFTRRISLKPGLAYEKCTQQLNEHAQPGREESRGRIIVVREYFEILFQTPKTLHKQCILEFPALEGLRTEEVATIKPRDMDFERGIHYVLDSKKHIYLPVNLDPTCYKHAMQLVKEKSLSMDDYLLQRRIKGGARPRDLNAPLTKQAIINTWWSLCDAVGIPRMSPRMGRAYFAAKWHFVDKKSDFGLMVSLRHSDIKVTQNYIAKCVSWEDVHEEFLAGREVPFQTTECANTLCLGHGSMCPCRLFLPKVEAKF